MKKQEIQVIGDCMAVVGVFWCIGGFLVDNPPMLLLGVVFIIVGALILKSQDDDDDLAF